MRISGCTSVASRSKPPTTGFCELAKEHDMQQRTLGPTGPQASAVGLGGRGMSAFYGARDAAESLDTLAHALARGVNFLDTADVYGPHTNEVLVGKAIAGKRDRVFLATKFGFVPDPNDPAKRTINGRPEYVR